MERVKLVIIGSGPAGYTAAIYAARANLAPVLYEGFYAGPAGGQLMTTTDVENFPGFPEGVSGPELMQKFRAQAVRFGTEVLTEDVSSVDFQNWPYLVNGGQTSYLADSVIISTGAYAKRLEIEGADEEGFWQKGVTACAVCDGAAPIFRNKPLFVIGGGDSAMEEALFLTKYGSKVTIVHRRDELRASKIMGERAMSHPKIEILWDSVITKIDGDTVVRKVIIENVKTREKTEWQAGGVFFAVGHVPNTAFLDGQIDLLENGYVAIKPGTSQTNVAGVFAAGDVADFTYRQAVTAAGTGCIAALEAERWLAHKE